MSVGVMIGIAIGTAFGLLVGLVVRLEREAVAEALPVARVRGAWMRERLDINPAMRRRR